MIALIDGDILVYRIGFAANDSPWPVCRWRLDEFMENILLFHLDVDDYEGWLTEGSNNYRHKIAKTAPYKGNRSGAKPVHYDSIREYLLSSWGFSMETTQEADDAIGISATILGDDALICTIDKDLDNIPGWHFNFVKNEKYYVTPEAAITNFYRQILVGDRIDNVKGLHRVGPVKASRILDGCAGDARALYEKCVEAYGGDSGRVIENAQLLWIRRCPDEIWQPPCLTEK